MNLVLPSAQVHHVPRGSRKRVSGVPWWGQKGGSARPPARARDGLRATPGGGRYRLPFTKLVCDALDRARSDAERLGHLQDTHALHKLLWHLAFGRAVYLSIFGRPSFTPWAIPRRLVTLNPYPLPIAPEVGLGFRERRRPAARHDARLRTHRDHYRPTPTPIRRRAGRTVLNDTANRPAILDDGPVLQVSINRGR